MKWIFAAFFTCNENYKKMLVEKLSQAEEEKEIYIGTNEALYLTGPDLLESLTFREITAEELKVLRKVFVTQLDITNQYHIINQIEHETDHMSWEQAEKTCQKLSDSQKTEYSNKFQQRVLEYEMFDLWEKDHGKLEYDDHFEQKRAEIIKNLTKEEYETLAQRTQDETNSDAISFGFVDVINTFLEYLEEEEDDE